MIKVLSVIASMDPVYGGPSQGLRNSIPEWSKLRVHAEVISLDDPSSSFLQKDPFKIYAIGEGKTVWKYNPRLYKWLVQYIADYDVVLVHGLWLYHGYAARKALQRIKKNRSVATKFPRLFVMPHGMLDPYFQLAPDRKLKAIRNWFYWKLVESKLINTAEGLFFTCEEELLLARKSFTPYKPKKEINVSYGIARPPTFISEMKDELEIKCPQIINKKYFLFLSRIHPKKGIDLLIKAYNKVANSVHTDGNKFSLPHLIVAGPGIDTHYGKQMQKMAEGQEIHFPGMLSGLSKWGAFYGCEAFILPSHQENFGIAVAESLACSKPVLISNQINIWKEIKNSNAGIIENDTEQGVENLLYKWLGMPDSAKEQMSINAYNCYQENFDVAASAGKLVKEVNRAFEK